MFLHPSCYAGDFNSPHTDFVYNNNSADEDCYIAWANFNNLALLYNPNDTASFFSGHWNTDFNLAFCSIGPDGRLPKGRVFEKFPRSQRRLSLITPPWLIFPLPGRSIVR